MSLHASGTSWWWLRSANNNNDNNFKNVNSDGSNNNNNASREGGVVVGSSPARRSKRDGQKPDRRNPSRRREGEADLRESENITPDGPGRTLLAWQCLVEDVLFHARWPYDAICNHPAAVRGQNETTGFVFYSLITGQEYQVSK